MILGDELDSFTQAKIRLLRLRYSLTESDQAKWFVRGAVYITVLYAVMILFLKFY